MTIVLKTFCEKLGEAAPGKETDASIVPEYLMNSLFWPYMRGENPRLDSLDYDAFELSDLDRLMEYIGDLQGFHRKAGRITGNLEKSIPLARASRSFC
jgi:hypothetical protein